MVADWYVPFETEKFLTATRGWPWQRAAFYALLLHVIYQLGGEVENDVDALRTWFGLDLKPKEFRDHRDALLAAGKLYLTPDGFLRNERADRFFAKRRSEKAQNELEKTPKPPEKVVENSVKNAVVSDTKKSSKNNKTPPELPLGDGSLPARARDSQSHSHSNSQTSTSPAASSLGEAIVQVGQIAQALGQDRGRYWERDYRRLLEDGLTFQDILEAAQSHRGDPIRGITALKGLAWAKQRARMVAPPAPPPPPAITDRVWGEALERLLSRGMWPDWDLGPCPTREGHRVPATLYAQWRALWDAQGGHPMTEIDYSGQRVPYPASYPKPEVRAIWSDHPNED